MTELEILQKQIESLKELIEVQNKVIETLKLQPQQVQYVPYYLPYQYPYGYYPYVSNGITYQGGVLSFYAQQGQYAGSLAAGAYDDGGQQCSAQQFNLGTILSLAK